MVFIFNSVPNNDSGLNPISISLIDIMNRLSTKDLITIGLHNVSKQAQNQLLCVTWLRCNETIYTMLISTCIRLLYHPWLFT